MMDIKIYQINLSRDDDRVAFLGLSQLDKFQESSKVNSEIYDKVFEGAVEADTLEGVYQKLSRLLIFSAMISYGRKGSVDNSRDLRICPSFNERTE